MIVIINSRDRGAVGEDSKPIYLGTLTTPPLNGADLTELVQKMWAEWRASVNDEPESDGQFIDWLVSEKHWSLIEEMATSVTVEW